MAFGRHNIIKDDYTDGKRVGTVKKASMVPSDDPIIKGLNFDFSKGEEKPTKPRAKPTLLKQARQRVDEAAVTLKEAEKTLLAAGMKWAGQQDECERLKRELPARFREGPCMGRWFAGDVKEMHAYYFAEQFEHASEVAWLRVVEGYSEAEKAHAEAVHACDEVKIAMLRRRLSVARMSRQKRKLGRFW